ncbi:hypothetical protein BH09MYX1_BH09MYX1_54310 [soil metagenome]
MIFFAYRKGHVGFAEVQGSSVPSIPNTGVLDAARDDALAAARPPSRVLEFFAVGGLTPFLFPLSWLLRRALGLDEAQLAVGFTFFYAAYVINDPHFAVTYLLFYKDVRARALGSAFPPSLRARYVIAGFLIPLILASWGIFAVVSRSPWVLGLLIQVMFFSVGWHYVKQGFGVMVVLAARRGLRFSAWERLAILAHCFMGWAYAWASPYDPGREVEEKGVVYRTIAHPHGLERLMFVVFLATLVPLAFVLVRKAIREKRLPIFTPLVAMLSSVWAWSIYSSIDPLVVYVVPALHSVQYLYVVWLLKRNEGREREGPPWFEPSAKTRIGVLAVSAIGLGILLFHVGPTALDDMLVTKKSAITDMGPTPWFAALYAFVNLHHYFMDNVIWRRDNPAMGYLRVP